MICYVLFSQGRGSFEDASGETRRLSSLHTLPCHYQTVGRVVVGLEVPTTFLLIPKSFVPIFPPFLFVNCFVVILVFITCKRHPIRVKSNYKY